MRKLEFLLPAFATLLLAAGPALADKYTDTISLFKNAGQSASFFSKSYGYAVFPTIGKAGLGIGGAHGEGRVYEQGKYVGDTKMTQLSIGFQAGREGLQRDHLLRGQAVIRRVHVRQLRVRRERQRGRDHRGRVRHGHARRGSTASASGGKKDAATAGSTTRARRSSSSRRAA